MTAILMLIFLLQMIRRKPTSQFNDLAKFHATPILLHNKVFLRSHFNRSIGNQSANHLE